MYKSRKWWNGQVFRSVEVHALYSDTIDSPEIDSRLENPIDKSVSLCLEAIRDSLIRQEDSIIFALLERAQYKRNAYVYKTNTVAGMSLLEYLLREQVGIKALQSSGEKRRGERRWNIF